MYELLRTISESRQIPSQANLRHYTADQLAELVVLYASGLYIMYSYRETEKKAVSYAKHTIQFGTNFEQWKSSGNDLYVMLYALKAIDVELDHLERSNKFKETMPFGEALLARWLKEMSFGHVNQATHRNLFTKLDSNFKINNSSIRAVRRMVMDWDNIEESDRRLTMTRILQLIKARAPRSEILDDLKKIGNRHDLIIDGSCNRETGDNCGSDFDYSPAEKKDKGENTLLTLATLAAGVAVVNALTSKKKATKESASCGATGSASIATAPTAIGGIGVGFDPNGDKGIYQNSKKKKPVILRR